VQPPSKRAANVRLGAPGFLHAPLLTERPSFRLLPLFRGTEHELLQGELFHVDLDQGATPYDALSYVWGVLAWIQLSIVWARTTNIEQSGSALRSLRKEYVDRIYRWMHYVSIRVISARGTTRHRSCTLYTDNPRTRLPLWDRQIARFGFNGYDDRGNLVALTPSHGWLR
ncbi:ankyrin repeat and sam domain containing protein 6, partial [Paraphaeosphaeria sporulosa]